MCPQACRLRYKPGEDLAETTCPCGFGYVDQSGVFVSGDRVRSGQALSREAYEAHRRSCPDYVDPSNRGVAATESAGDSRQKRRSFMEYFMPEEGIDSEILTTYVAKEGPNASVKPTTFQGRRGYLIHTHQRLTPEIEARIKAESAQKMKPHQKREQRLPEQAPVASDTQAYEPRSVRRPFQEDVASRDSARPDPQSGQPLPGYGQYPTYTSQSQPRDLRSTGASLRGPQQPSFQSPSSAHARTQYESYQAPSPPQPPIPHGQPGYHDQQSSLAERFGDLAVSPMPQSEQYGTTPNPNYQRSLFPASTGQQGLSDRSYPPISGTFAQRLQTGGSGSGGWSSQTALPYDQDGNTITPKQKSSRTESLHYTKAEPRRASTLTPGDPRYSAPYHARATQSSQTEQSEENSQRDQIPEQTYHGSREQRTVIASGTRRPYAEPTNIPATRSPRRHQASIVQPPDDETEERPKQSKERRYRS